MQLCFYSSCYVESRLGGRTGWGDVRESRETSEETCVVIQARGDEHLGEKREQHRWRETEGETVSGVGKLFLQRTRK